MRRRANVMNAGLMASHSLAGKLSAICSLSFKKQRVFSTHDAGQLLAQSRDDICNYGPTICTDPPDVAIISRDPQTH